MYELEVDHDQIPETLLSSEIKACFRDETANMTAISLISWAEHCTECAMPACFASCDLYQPRKDGKCRRFLNGISPVMGAPNPQGYIARTQFKRWGVLFGYGNAHRVPIRTAKLVERVSRNLEQVAARIPDGSLSIGGRRGISSRLVSRLKKKLNESGFLSTSDHPLPDYFLVEVYNPNEHSIKLSLTIRNPDGTRRPARYENLLGLQPGFSRFKLPTSAIAAAVDVSKSLHVSFDPNLLRAEEEGLTLFFGMLTFVWDSKYSPETSRPSDGPTVSVTTDGPTNKRLRSLGDPARDTPELTVPKAAKTIKLVIWDLDNTLWDGILVEDGPEGVKLKPGVLGLIQELDRRGILQSIASKNNPELAMAQLRTLGLDEYFLFPRIGWNTKGRAVKELVEEFNIGPDTVAFIDDSPFEREEVATSNPLVRVFPETIRDALLTLPEFSPIATTDASRRRHLYTIERERGAARSNFHSDYLSFLRSCEMRLIIRPISELNVDRAHELIQRTNQLNFSGNRYTRAQVTTIVKDPRYDHYGIECVDRFGEYGMVGFAVVEKAGPRLVDLMLSCRVQAKRVEHAFISFLLKRYYELGLSTFEALYRPTERNQEAGKVFSDLGFSVVQRSAAGILFMFNLRAEISTEGIVLIEWEEPAFSA